MGILLLLGLSDSELVILDGFLGSICSASGEGKRLRGNRSSGTEKSKHGDDWQSHAVWPAVTGSDRFML